MPHCLYKTRRSAFSLVEIAIVMAIIGLLVGGVLMGQSLLKGQQLRSVGTDASNYMIAMKQFQQKYNSIPGDFPTATEVWGTVGGGTVQCAAPNTTASVGATTCNGDGNGFLTVNTHEPHRAWQHLVAASFIRGTFTGIAPYALGVSAPKATLGNTGFGWVGGLIQVDAVNTNAAYFDGDYTNMLTFGTQATLVDGAALLPKQASQLDWKFDDGLPSTGSIRIYRSNTACAPTASTYNLSSTTVSCALLFLSSFKTGQ